MGYVWSDLKQEEKAIVHYQKAVELDPSISSAWNNMGLALRQLGRTEEAIAAYDGAVAADPTNYEAWDN